MQRASSILGSLTATLVNLVVALLLGGLLVAAVGADPLAALRVVYNGAFGSSSGLSYTFYYATNYIFAGLAFAVAAQASQFNIGAEGQAYIGGLGTGLACLALPGVPWWLALPAAVVVSGLFGAAWAFVPAVMEARRGSHLIITTIMFNFLASLLMTFVIVNLLRVPGSAIPSSGPMPESSYLPRVDQILTAIGIPTGETPLTIMIVVAIAVSLVLVWLIWHTRWGYELRAIGKSPDAAAFAGVNVARMKVQAICLSGAIAGMIGVNEVMGAQHRVLLELAAGYGFTGIAVALIGANHPAGIIPAAILFGALQQGGASLSFMFPTVSRDVVVIVQGLVILLAGGLIHILRPMLVNAFAVLLHSEREGLMDLIQVIASTLRLAVPLIFAAMAGLYAERSGLVDIGLEGKMLTGAFVGAAVAALSASPWIGLLAAVLAGGLIGLAQGAASITFRGNQLVIGLAINIIAAGLTAFLGIAWFQRGGQTPQLSEAERFGAIQLPFAQEIAQIPVIGPLYSTVIGGQTILGYAAIASIIITWLVIYRTRFGLRLMAAGDRPEAVESAGVSVIRLRYYAIFICGCLCGMAGAYLSIVQGGAFYRDMSAGQGFMALAALIFGGWRPVRVALACLLFAGADAVQGRLQGVQLFGWFEAPTQVVQAIPYVLTLILLAGFVGRFHGPAAAGRPYVRGQR